MSLPLAAMRLLKKGGKATNNRTNQEDYFDEAEMQQAVKASQVVNEGTKPPEDLPYEAEREALDRSRKVYKVPSMNMDMDDHGKLEKVLEQSAKEHEKGDKQRKKAAEKEAAQAQKEEKSIKKSATDYEKAEKERMKVLDDDAAQEAAFIKESEDIAAEHARTLKAKRDKEEAAEEDVFRESERVAVEHAERVRRKREKRDEEEATEEDIFRESERVAVEHGERVRRKREEDKEMWLRIMGPREGGELSSWRGGRRRWGGRMVVGRDLRESEGMLLKSKEMG